MGMVLSVVAGVGTVVSTISTIVALCHNRPQNPAPISETAIESQMANNPENQKLIKRLEKIEDELAQKSAALESIEEKMKEGRRFVEESKEKMEREREIFQKMKDNYEKKKEEIKEQKLSAYQSIVAEIREKAVRQLGLDCVTSYNVAITGQSGAGKSTLINYLCGYKDDQDGAAKTDVAECTRKIEKYVHPKINHLVLWDCPGAGTMANPIQTYFEDKMLCVFDFLVIVFTERFKEIDATLIKKAIKNKIPVAIVRNKANHDLAAFKKKAEFKDLHIDEIKTKLIEKLRQDTKTCLIQLGDFARPDIFIINSWAFGDEDQPKFEEGKLLEYVAKMMIELRQK